MEPWEMETRLIDACLALGYICTGEAKWADDPEVKAAMVRHAIGFLDAARGLLPPPRATAKFVDPGALGRNHIPVEEA